LEASDYIIPTEKPPNYSLWYHHITDDNTLERCVSLPLSLSLTHSHPLPASVHSPNNIHNIPPPLSCTTTHSE